MMLYSLIDDLNAKKENISLTKDVNLIAKKNI